MFFCCIFTHVLKELDLSGGFRNVIKFPDINQYLFISINICSINSYLQHRPFRKVHVSYSYSGSIFVAIFFTNPSIYPSSSYYFFCQYCFRVELQKKNCYSKYPIWHKICNKNLFTN